MDWIEKFLEVTEGIPSPKIFRLWAAIAALSGVLERRIFTRTRAVRPAYPNIYVCLAGKSGSGKSEAINVCRDLWAGVGEIKLSPDNLTNAAFYDALSESMRTHVNGSGASIYHAMGVCCRELGVLLPRYDIGFLSDLSDLYDNLEHFHAKRRTSKTVQIDYPTVNIIAGCTPAFLGDLLPEVAWGQGFCSRMIFIYGNRIENNVDILRPRKGLNLSALRARLTELLDLSGEVEWSREAHQAINDWYNSGQQPVPNHFRLREYCERRAIHLLKLSMISAVSAGRDLWVGEQDFQRAQKWLFDAEDAMPDVFRAMGARSDIQILDELHYWAYTTYHRIAADKRKPLKEENIWAFLRERVESHRIKSMVETAVMSGMLRRSTYPGEFTPGPIDKHLGK